MRSPLHCSGLIPLNIHMDGAEFYSNSEFNVWSIGSVFAWGEDSWRICTSCLRTSVSITGLFGRSGISSSLAVSFLTPGCNQMKSWPEFPEETLACLLDPQTLAVFLGYLGFQTAR